jgi:hypothetical protein
MDPIRQRRGECLDSPRMRGNAKLLQHIGHRSRHERLQQCGDHPHRIHQHAQHRAHPDFVGFVQSPGSLTVDVSIGGAADFPDFLQRLMERLPLDRGPHQTG